MDFTENKHAQKAAELFHQGYNCSQAVMGAWAEELGLPLDMALKLSAGFGGGVGRLREVCGAVSGGCMALSLRWSTGQPDPESKKKMYEIIQNFARRFQEVNGANTIVCRELLGIQGSSQPTPAERTDSYYKKRPCVQLVEISAAVLEEFM